MKRILVFLLLLISLISEGQVSRNYTIDKTIEGSRAYRKRVTADAGVIRSDGLEKAYRAMLISNGIASPLFSWFGEAGAKFRTSGINSYYTKLYSTVGTNDAAQSTDLNQPFRSGDIAPNERYCLKNPNGASRYVTHTAASFLATDPWSVECVVNWSGSNVTYGTLISSINNSANTFWLKYNGLNKFAWRNSAGTEFALSSSTAGIIGKTVVITIVANGSGLISLYINGVFVESSNSIPTSFVFDTLMARSGGQVFGGKFYSYNIFNKALSASECLSRYNFLRSIYPEIESVKIGNQYWATSNYEAVCTPQGNLINEVQGATNTEKIVNGGFDADANWTKGDQTTISISGGIATFNNTPNSNAIYQTGGVVVGRWYKFNYTILSITSGSLAARITSDKSGISRNSAGTYTEYLQASVAGGLGIIAVGTTTATIDNISVQEVGWADSQNLYDAIYAATSGTTEQKTYAAVKAAGMWCHYNNDPITGAVYGKLYNWFAVKLLQMDIDYYNTANPSTPWGWRVPTDADFTTLQTTLGGSTVAGGKMKVSGTSYFNSPNTGADNSSGFSAIGGGFRDSTGSFSSILSISSYLCLNNAFGTRYDLISFMTGSPIGFISTRGYSLRLIKS